MELHGITGAPYKTPQVRKKLPAPFARPVIDLDGGRHRKRSWKDTSVLDLRKGDVVSGYGKVDVVEESIRVSPAFDEDNPADVWRVRVYNVMGAFHDFGGHDRVYAFTVDDDQPE